MGGPVVGAILIGALSGAAGAAASNVTSQVISNKGFNNFDFGSLGKDVLIGAAIGGAFAGAGEGIKAIKNAKSFNRLKALGEMKPVTPKGVQPLPTQGVNLPTPKQVNIPKPPVGSIQVGQALHTQVDNVLQEGIEIFSEGAAKGGNKVQDAAKVAKSWLGKESKVVTNKAGDNIFMSKDGLRKIRFDIKNPHGDAPDIHFEEFLNGKWRDAIPGIHRIYPKQ